MKALSLLLILPVLGCASPGTNTFTTVDPVAQGVENSALINEPFEEVWDTLVANLSESFFVINNIEKESRLINVSFSSNTPEEYVDCGRTKRTAKRGSEVETYDYAVAESSTYKIFSKSMNNNVTTTIRRETSLEGRINIYVAPEGEGTRINVNTRYILTIKAGGFWESANPLSGVKGSGMVDPSTTVVNFGTKEPGKEFAGVVDGKEMSIRCNCKGTLERKILEMAQK